MHELSLCHAIVGVVKPHVDGRRVDLVRLQVGALRQVVPETLEFCWSIVCEQLDDALSGAALELELIPAAVQCRTCGLGSTIESRWSVCCPSCGSADVEVVAGNEFLVTSVEVS